MAVWTQISEWKFQKTSKAFFPERSLNKKLRCPCISFLGSSTLWRPHCPYFKPKCKRPANITHGVSEQGRTSYATSFAGMPGWRISLHLSPMCYLVAGVPVIWPEANLLFWPHISWKESAGQLRNPGVHNCNIFSFKWNFPLESVLMALVMTAFFLPEQNRCRNFFCIYEQVSLIDTAISQKVCKQRYTQRCRESYSKISHVHTCTYTSCKTPSSSV